MKAIEQVSVPGAKEVEAIWLDRVRRWKSSGMTGQEFAAQERVAVNRLHAWTSKFRKSGIELPVRGTAPTGELIAITSSTSMVVSSIEIEVGRATVRVREGFDPALLRQVMAALEGRS